MFGSRSETKVHSLWVMARFANLPAAKSANLTPPRSEAVAPVTSSVGGWGEESTEARRRGSVAWAKLKRP